MTDVSEKSGKLNVDDGLFFTTTMPSLTGSNYCNFEHPNYQFDELKPYNPNLTLKEFFIYPYVKNKLRGELLTTSQEVVAAFRIHVLKIPQSEWQECFGNWLCKWITLYIEKQ